MNKYLILILSSFILSCNQKKAEDFETRTDLRAKTDTTLSFQGIGLGEEYNPSIVDSITKNLPIVLYNDSNKAFTFQKFEVKADTVGNGVVVKSIYLNSNNDDPYDFLSLVKLYADNYGDFSYYQYDKDHKEVDIIRIGDMKYKSSKRNAYIDATQAYLAAHNYVKSDTQSAYQFSFVWEWKNQTIIVRHNLDNWLGIADILPKTSITYFNFGSEERTKAQEALQQRKDSLEKAEQIEIEKRKAKQQI